MNNKYILCLFFFLFSFHSMASAQTNEQNNNVILSHLADLQAYLCYIEVDEKNNWWAQDISGKQDLDKIYDRYKHNNGLIIPIFPTVYSPGTNYKADLSYYNSILKDNAIKKGSKILVIGSGSGSDAWAAWLKSQSLIYAVDINPMAVTNTRATAQIAGFPVKAIQGDIRTMSFPADFVGFDDILWNMPFLENCDYKQIDFHDCDNGDVLNKFLELMPQLLKRGGKVIVFNTKEAVERINKVEGQIADLKIDEHQ